MDLTELERRRLADIEGHLAWSDPDLATLLCAGHFRHQRRHRTGTSLVTASMAIFAVGIITQTVLVLVAGWALWAAGITLRRFAN